MTIFVASFVLMGLFTSAHGVSLVSAPVSDWKGPSLTICDFLSPAQAGGMRGSSGADQDHTSLARNQNSHQPFADKPFPRALQKGRRDVYHGRQLATTEKYVTSGMAASASSSWQTTGCDFYNTMTFSAYENINKYILNGSPSTTTDRSASFQLITYADCDETSAATTYAAFDTYDSNADFALAVAKNLGSGSFTASINGTFITESCTRFCYAHADDDNADDDGDGIHCNLGNCTTVSEQYGIGDFDVSWVGESIPSNSSSKGKYDSVAYKSRSTSTGQDRAASVTVSFSFDGDVYGFPADANFTGNLQRSTSTDTYVSN